MRGAALVSLAVAFVASSALGQSTNPESAAPGNPAGMSPDTRQSAPGAPARNQTNQADRAFVRAAGAGGSAEVNLGKLAAEKALSRPVREFAQRMVNEHSAANERLAKLAKTSAIALPDKPSEEHRAMRLRLDRADGAQFDRAYIEGQIIDQQKTAMLLEYEIGSGQSAEIKAFASDVLPMVLGHLRMAQELAASITQPSAAEVLRKEAPRERK